MVLRGFVAGGNIGPPRRHFGQSPSLEVEQILRRKPCAFEIGRPEHPSGAKKGKGLLTFGSGRRHIA
jgi:hypothetical protein